MKIEAWMAQAGFHQAGYHFGRGDCPCWHGHLVLYIYAAIKLCEYEHIIELHDA